MTLDEWHEVLATEPATPYQRGAIMGEFDRLGYGRADRADRLAICAALLDLDELGSTAHLMMGQAGQLYRLLLGIGDRAELLAAAGLDEGQDAGLDLGGQMSGPTLGEGIGTLLAQLAAILTITRRTHA